MPINWCWICKLQGCLTFFRWPNHPLGFILRFSWKAYIYIYTYIYTLYAIFWISQAWILKNPLFRKRPHLRFGFQVDSHAFASMLCILVSEGEINDAFEVYDDMLAAGYLDVFFIWCFLYELYHGIHYHPDHHLVDVFWDVFSKHQTCKSEDMKLMLLASRLYCVDHFNTVIWILQHGSLVMPKIEVDLYPVNPWNCSSCKQHDGAVGNWRNPSWKRPNVQVSWFQSVLWTASTGLVDTLLLKSGHQFFDCLHVQVVVVLLFLHSDSAISAVILIAFRNVLFHSPLSCRPLAPFHRGAARKKRTGVAAGRPATASCACIKLLLSRWLNATNLSSWRSPTTNNLWFRVTFSCSQNCQVEKFSRWEWQL